MAFEILVSKQSIFIMIIINRRLAVALLGSPSPITISISIYLCTNIHQNWSSGLGMTA